MYPDHGDIVAKGQDPGLTGGEGGEGHEEFSMLRVQTQDVPVLLDVRMREHCQHIGHGHCSLLASQVVAGVVCKRPLGQHKETLLPVANRPCAHQRYHHSGTVCDHAGAHRG